MNPLLLGGLPVTIGNGMVPVRKLMEAYFLSVRRLLDW